MTFDQVFGNWLTTMAILGLAFAILFYADRSHRSKK